MEYNLAGNPEKFAVIAELMGYDTDGSTLMEAAGQSVRAVRGLLDALKVSCRLADYELPTEKALKGNTARWNGSLILFFRRAHTRPLTDALAVFPALSLFSALL